MVMKWERARREGTGSEIEIGTEIINWKTKYRTTVVQRNRIWNPYHGCCWQCCARKLPMIRPPPLSLRHLFAPVLDSLYHRNSSLASFFFVVHTDKYNINNIKWIRIYKRVYDNTDSWDIEAQLLNRCKERNCAISNDWYILFLFVSIRILTEYFHLSTKCVNLVMLLHIKIKREIRQKFSFVTMSQLSWNSVRSRRKAFIRV